MASILVIDDNADLRDFIRAVLESEGHEVTEAGDGREGLRAYKANPVDLIITDIAMPEMDGIQLLQSLRLLPEPPQIIAISGDAKFRFSPALYLKIARQLGCRHTLDKPMGIDDLLNAVNDCLSELPPKTS